MQQDSLLAQLRKKADAGSSSPVSENTDTAAKQPPLPAINPPEGDAPGPTPEEKKADAQTAAPPADEKPKRTRRKKSEAAAEQNAAPPVAEANQPADTIPAPAPEATTEKTAFVLYVDAYPVGETARFIDGIIEKAKVLVVEECSTHADPDYRVGHYKFVPFGKGPGCLEIAFFKLFDAEPASDWIVYTATEEVSYLLAGLVARANRSGGHTIRGVR